MRKEDETIASTGGFDGKKDDFPPRGVCPEPEQKEEKKD